jgi:hypothetical protein
LIYAHEHGCPWNKMTYKCAIYANSFECLKYAHENGCEYNLNKCIALAVYHGSTKCLWYLQQLVHSS